MNKLDRLIKNFPFCYSPATNKFLDGLLESIAESDEDIQLNLTEANNQLFVELASGKYLEDLGSSVGVPKYKPRTLSINDDDYRQIIPILSYFPKQVKTTIYDLLDAFWGETYSRANVTSNNYETFNLGNFVNLTGNLNFVEDGLTVSGVGTLFTVEINVGDYINATSLNNSNFVRVSRIIDNQTLKLSSKYSGKNYTGPGKVYTPKSLQISSENGDETIIIKPTFFEDDPSLVTSQEICNSINNSAKYIKSETYYSPADKNIYINIRTKTTGLLGYIQVNGGTLNSIVNFSTNKYTINDLFLTTQVFEINSREIVVKIPSSVPIIRRSLKGSIHFQGNMSGDIISVDNINKTVTVNMYDSVIINEFSNQKFSQNMFEYIIISHTSGTNGVIFQFSDGDDLSNINISYRFFILDINDNIEKRYIGSYLFDNNNTYSSSWRKCILNQTIVPGNVYPSINVIDSSDITDSSGWLVLNMGGDNEEKIKYRGRPNNSTLLLDPSYIFTDNHYANEMINIITNEPFTPDIYGNDYSIYIVGTEEPREVVQELIQKIIACGVIVRFIIESPQYYYGSC